MARIPRNSVALIILEYDAYSVDYQRFIVKDTRTNPPQNYVFADHNDPILDYAEAYSCAWNLGVDEIVLHESCEYFCKDTNFKYVFDINNQLVEREYY